MTERRSTFRVVMSPALRLAVPGAPSRRSGIEAARDLLSQTRLTPQEHPRGSVLHVVSSPKGWIVRPEGRNHGAWEKKVFPNQSEAVSAAKSQAREVNSRVVIHSKSGKIRDTLSYK